MVDEGEQLMNILVRGQGVLESSERLFYLRMRYSDQKGTGPGPRLLRDGAGLS